jgi:hypothetical protein
MMSGLPNGNKFTIFRACHFPYDQSYPPGRQTFLGVRDLKKPAATSSPHYAKSDGLAAPVWLLSATGLGDADETHGAFCPSLYEKVH